MEEEDSDDIYYSAYGSGPGQDAAGQGIVINNPAVLADIFHAIQSGKNVAFTLNTNGTYTIGYNNAYINVNDPDDNAGEAGLLASGDYKTGPVGNSNSPFLAGSTELRTDVDPSTLGRNIFDSNYIGANNPLDYNGNYSYSVEPRNKPDRPAEIHDLTYDKLNITGAGGMIFETKALPADITLIYSEFEITVDETASLKEKAQAFVVSIGVQTIIAPKLTYFFYSQAIKSIAGLFH